MMMMLMIPFNIYGGCALGPLSQLTKDIFKHSSVCLEKNEKFKVYSDFRDTIYIYRHSISYRVHCFLFVIKLFHSYTAVTCGLLKAPVSGGLDCSNSDEFGSICSFFCDEGYRLINGESRVCTEDHLWSGAQPSCERKFVQVDLFLT